MTEQKHVHEWIILYIFVKGIKAWVQRYFYFFESSLSLLVLVSLPLLLPRSTT